MASQFSIKLSVSAADLIKSIKKTIDDINSGDKLKNKPLNISVSAAKLRESIRAAIDEINSGDKLKSKPINITASESYLRKSLVTAINNINSSGALTNKPVKITAKIDTKSLAQQLQAQVTNATAKASTLNIGTNTNAATLKESVNAITNAVNNENSAIEATNNLLKEQQKLFLKTGNIRLTQTFGSSGQTVANTYLNGNQVTQTITNDFSRQQKEADKAYAAYSRLDDIINKLQADFADPNAVKPIREQANIDELNAALTETRSKIEAVKTASAESFSRLKADADSSVESLKLLIRTKQNEEYAATTLRTLDVPTIKAIQTNAFDELKAKINASKVPLSELTVDLTEIQRLLNNIADRNSLTAYLNQLNIVESKFDNLKAKAKKTSDFSKQIKSDLDRLNKLTSGTIFKNNESNAEVVNLRSQIQALIEKYQALKAASANSNTPEQMATNIESLRALQSELDIIVKDTDLIKSNLRDTRIDSRLQTQIVNLNAQISEFTRKNGKALNVTNPLSGLSFGTELQNIKSALPNTQDVATFNDLNNQFVMLRANIQNEGLTGNTFFTEITNKAKKFAQWFGVTYALTKARMYFNKLFTTVYELDTALVDLKKTFRGTDNELNQFYLDSNKLAKQLGVTTQEIIQQGAAFSRLGFSSKETMETMAKMSSMFAAISPDMDTTQASDGLVSIMKAFDIDPENVLDGILSKINIIGNTAATSNGEIVEMLKRSSAAMREANNTLEQTISLEIASQEILRDADVNGTAWRTISARLRGLDEETLQVSDDVVELTGKLADVTKTASKPGGISVFTDSSKTTYKSTYQIIKELSEIWDELNDSEHAKIEDIVGGKRQLQVVSAAISNFKAAEQAMDNMANSAGNAEAEMDVVRESAAYALNELKETFTSLAQHSVSRGGLKELINAGTTILGIVDGIVEKIGLIPTILTTVAGIITSKKMTKGGLFGLSPNEKTGKTGLTFLGTQVGKDWWGNVTGSNQIKEIQNNIKAVNEFHTALKSGQMTMEKYNAVMKNSNPEIKRYGRAALQASNDTSVFRKTTKNLNAQLKGVEKSGKIAAVGLKAAEIGVQALNAAVSMGISLLVSFALNAIIKGIDDAVHAVENQRKKVEELIQNESSLKSEIESLNDELKTTKTRIYELENMGSLTLLEEGELTKLQKANDELERQILLKRGELTKTSSDKNKEAQALWDKMTHGLATNGNDKVSFWEGAGLVLSLPNYISAISDFQGENKRYDSIAGWQTQDINKYIELLNKINEMKNSDEYKNGDKDFNEKIKEAESELSELHDKIQGYYNDFWMLLSTGLDPNINSNKEIIEWANERIKVWEDLNKINYENFGEIYSSSEFTYVVKKLEEMAEKGELVAETFAELDEKAVPGITRFKEALASVGETDFKNICDRIVQQVEATANGAGIASAAFENFGEQIKKVQELIENFISSQEKLNDAFKKLKLGGSLDDKEIFSLLSEFPKLADYLTETADGWMISEKGFIELSDQITNDEKSKLEKTKSELEDYIHTVGMLEALNREARASFDPDAIYNSEEYMKWYDKTEEIRKKLGISSAKGWSVMLDDFVTELNGVEFQLDLIDKMFNKHTVGLEGLKESYKDAESEISDFNNQIKTVDNAIKKLSEGSLLDYEELNSLLAIDDTLQYDASENGYSITVESLEEVRKKSYETRNSRIKDIIAIVEAEKAAAETSKEEYQKILADMSKTHLWEDAYKNFLAANSQIEYSCELINRLNGLMQDITYDDSSENNISNELQDKIDYYKTILDAISAVKDRYTEAIDNEIDALEESKDALKDANDERQRELDLIEARNNLENAKKRKVYVYTEGEGFKQVQDKAAIKEAEEKYRDVITDIQTAEIDKAIDEKEKQKEALEQSVKDLLELEQNIQDSLAISQAMKAYGLTDPSQLLNLSDSIKNDIIGGLADSELKKDIEENKDNTKYIAVTLDDILANLGSNKTMNDLSSDVLDNVKEAAYKSVVDGFVQAAKDMADNMINNTTNVNNPTINQTNSIVINDATDPEKVGQAVGEYIKGMLTQYNNSLK